jgi:PDZ domain-containing protein
MVLVSRRSQTYMIGLLILLVVGLIAGFLPVPLVALGPGPSYDTLGADAGKPVVTINGLPTYPTSGHLNMTTVRVSDGLTALMSLRSWADPQWRVVPREAIYPTGKTDDEVKQENSIQFTDSEVKAEVAALSYLAMPVKVIVDQVLKGAPAAPVLQPGDQILSVNGVPVSSPGQVYDMLTRTKPGDKVRIGLRRGPDPTAKPTEGVVTVGTRPPDRNGAPDGPQGFLGIVPGALPLDPNQIKIELNDIGGPSAGLMFTLALIDKLTPGELTGGRFVAGTGTITAYGTVGKIDGIAQKMIGARDAGATVFLVPVDNCAQAVKSDHDGLQLIKVSTVSDAVNGLNALNRGEVPPGC